MVNFRYHLVSLIAVFLALAVGVVLGAGPLQRGIGRSWDDGATRGGASPSDASALRADVDAQDAFVDAVAKDALPGTLDGVSVATVALPGAESADVSRVGSYLKRAGATVVGAVALTRDWTSQDFAQYRETVSSPVLTHVRARVPSDASADEILGYALMQVLTEPGSESELITQILTDPQTPLLSVRRDPKGRAQAIVVVGPRAGASSGAADSDAASGLATAVARAPKSGVVFGDASSAGGFVSVVRAAKAAVTSVDSVGTNAGALAVALALPGASAKARAFGAESSARDGMPSLPAR